MAGRRRHGHFVWIPAKRLDPIEFEQTALPKVSTVSQYGQHKATGPLHHTGSPAKDRIRPRSGAIHTVCNIKNPLNSCIVACESFLDGGRIEILGRLADERNDHAPLRLQPHNSST